MTTHDGTDAPVPGRAPAPPDERVPPGQVATAPGGPAEDGAVEVAVRPDVGDPGDDAARAARRRRTEVIVDVVVVAACVVFVLLQLQPDLLVRDTTPAGGDMGAHVWGPAYLRDHLLPNGLLAGWTHDWYAGFPAYHFYMVVPSLLIVVLDAGAHGWAALVPLAAALALAAVAIRRRDDARVRRAAIVGAVVAACAVGLPYGVAFKWVSVSGLVTLPVAAYALGRLGGARFPTPAVLAASTLPFVFYRGFTIYGGNAPSTLAGEFAFSMSLSLALLYVGVVIRGLETGRHRALAAVLLALTGLCHIIPAFFALVATAVALAVRFRQAPTPWLTGVASVLVGAGTAAIGAGLGATGGGAPLVVAVLGTLVAAAGLWQLSESVRWLAPTLVVGGLLSAFWVLPFYLRKDYLNDMGWEKLPHAGSDETVWQYLIPSDTPDVDLRWVFALALVGAGVSVLQWLLSSVRARPDSHVAHRARLGVLLAAVTVLMATAFVVMPEGRLWNGRLLPFYYLSAMLLAGLAIAEVVRMVAQLVRHDDRPGPEGVVTALAVLGATLVVVGLPLGALPLSQRAGAGYDWPSVSPWQLHAEPESFVTSWAKWNYSGYELKDSYREYHDVVNTMDEVGRDRGCGRAFWEYEKELDRYGTPMALMLLPHWTDGCIGSMEGLYFEASATTPFHFLTQVELSTNPSAAQRDLPYGTFDIERGVDHLQMMGVRYYMATSDAAVDAARGHPDLEEVATSGPWAIFEVAGADLVEGVANEPAVVTGIDHSQREWVEEPHDESGRFGGPAVTWFNDPARWPVPLVADGPEGWQRVAGDDQATARPVEPVEVSQVEVDDDGISFDVDQVGRPVVVKVSYFPNWQADGADGPFRAAPNFMVVVPTETHVELSYGRTSVEWLSYALTALGLVGLVVLVRRGTVPFRAPRRRPVERSVDRVPVP